jgi:hypothetical protein
MYPALHGSEKLFYYLYCTVLLRFILFQMNDAGTYSLHANNRNGSDKVCTLYNAQM